MVILQVDDNEQDRVLFEAAVFNSNAEITLRSVVNGSEAVSYLEGKGVYQDRSQYPLPDVMVLDLEMPKMGGMKFLDWKGASPFRNIPVVVLSGGMQATGPKPSLAKGALLSLPKPSTFQGLTSLVRTISRINTGGRRDEGGQPASVAADVPPKRHHADAAPP